MTDQKSITRRVTPRYELEKEFSGYTHYRSHTHLVDLSSSGALIEFQLYLKPGTEIVLSLPIGGSSHRVECFVVHCSMSETAGAVGRHGYANYRIGIQFSDLPPATRTTINNLIKSRLENERREQPRLYIGRPAEIEETVELHALNLSIGGGLFISNSPLEYGSCHDFVFRLPNGEVRAQGIVCHCHAGTRWEDNCFQVGVEFKELLANGREIVERYLNLIERRREFKG